MGVSEEWGVLCNQAISACAGLEIHPTHGTAHTRHCTHTQVPSLLNPASYTSRKHWPTHSEFRVSKAPANSFQD